MRFLRELLFGPGPHRPQPEATGPPQPQDGVVNGQYVSPDVMTMNKIEFLWFMKTRLDDDAIVFVERPVGKAVHRVEKWSMTPSCE